MPFDDVKIPFGKEHRGKRLADCPVEYLDWLIGQDWLFDDLKFKITTHLKSRPDWHTLDDDETPTPTNAKDDYVCPKCCEVVTSTGYCKSCGKVTVKL